MFGTSGIRGRVGEAVTADLALSVGRALASEGYGRVVVGRDVRESGAMLADALAAGVQEGGGDVVDVGLAATPTVARSVDWLDADAGVVITASHNPPEDNGIKLWSPSGQAFDAERRAAIAERLEAGADEGDAAYDLADWDGVGGRTDREGMTDRHARAIRESIVDRFGDALGGDRPLGGLSIVVGVGNGAGTVTADALVDLGASVQTLNAQPDGRFPARPSEPTAESLEVLRQVVGATDADLGVAHDGDADRTMAVDGTGAFVPKDVLLALFARAAAERAGSGVRVAAPLNTSLAVDDALESVEASVTRTPVGDVHVAERATESDVVFGGEPSGAWIWPDETLCPDGPLAACTLAAMVARRGSLADQVAAVDSYPIRRDAIEVDDRTAVMDDVEARVRERGDAFDATDGIRIEADEGWTLIRPSGTQPLVRVTAEARDAGRADDLFEDARSLVLAAVE